MTGHGTVDSAVDGMHMGAFDYAMKPIVLRDLIEKIQQAIERKGLQEASPHR